jgi:hypothetical protein
VSNQIYFNVDKNRKVKVSFKNPVPFTDFLQIISTGILTAMFSIVNSAPEDQRPQVKEELYDMYNAAASNLLSFFAPEIEMRPHLTTQAILEAENAIIQNNADFMRKLTQSEKPNLRRVK